MLAYDQAATTAALAEEKQQSLSEASRLLREKDLQSELARHRQALDESMDQVKQQASMRRKLRRANLTVLHAVGDKTNKITYGLLGANKSDVPTRLAALAEEIHRAEQDVQVRQR